MLGWFRSKKKLLSMIAEKDSEINELACQIGILRAARGDVPDALKENLPNIRFQWFGGECPVPDNCKVELIFRDGEIHVANRPQKWEWAHCRVLENCPTDIVAYRILGDYE